jgi:hypothetical protein
MVKILTAIENGCPTKVLVSMDAITEDQVAKAAKLGAVLKTIKDVEKMVCRN